MELDNNLKITVETTVNAPIEKVWKFWTESYHITNWNKASDDWHTPYSENDLRVGGKFLSRMEAKDGSFGFDFTGVYDEVELYETISYTITDGRKVNIIFMEQGMNTKIIETIEIEKANSIELQQNGWQAIIDNFKKYTEEK